jgi:hypothetical protein
MRFQVIPDKKAKQWIYDFNSVSTTDHFEELEQIFCESLLITAIKGRTSIPPKQSRPMTNTIAVGMQLKRTDGLSLKRDGFLEFLKTKTPFKNIAGGVENGRNYRDSVTKHLREIGVTL